MYFEAFLILYDMQRDFKGIWIEKELYLVDKKVLSWPEKILLKEIHSFTTDGAGCYASNEYLSNFIGVKEGTLANMKTKLRKMGLIENVGFNDRTMSVKTTDNYIQNLKKLSQMNEGRVHLKMKAGFTNKLRQDSFKNEHNNTLNNTIINIDNIDSVQIENLPVALKEKLKEEIRKEDLKKQKQEEKEKEKEK